MDIRNQYYFSFSKDFDTQTKNLFIENFKKNKYFNSFKYIEFNANFTKSVKKYNYYLENGELIPMDQIFDYPDEKYVKLLTNNNTTSDNISTNNKSINNSTSSDIPTNNEMNDNDNAIKDHSTDDKVVQEYKILIFDNENDLFEVYRNNYLNNEKFSYDNENYVKIDSFIITFKSLTEYTLYSEFSLYELELIDIAHEDTFYYYQKVLDYSNLQILTSNTLMNTLNTNTNANIIPEIEFNFKTMDKLGSETIIRNENKVLESIPLYMLFYFIPCVCSLLSNLVIEKESKIKESLVIIGMKKSTFWLSWAITYSIIIIISSSIATFVMRYLRIFFSIHWSIILITMILYGLSCICISFVLSTVINKSKTSNTLGALIILTFFSLYFLNTFLENGTITKWIFCFVFPPVSFLSLMDYLIKLESHNLPISFLSIFSNINIKNYFIVIFSSFIVYFLLALYLDNVLPQGSNLHKKWYFFITDPLRKLSSKTHTNNDNDNNIKINESNNPFIEKDPEGLKKSVMVNHVSRNFKVKEGQLEILKDISFNAYNDEILAILGHNGAGKTTLLRIMTGVLASTRGEVYYDNTPIHGNETDICKQFGYCPQFDTFSKNLTVGEHVKLFAGIKGIKVDVDEILKDIDLLHKKNNFPKQLSGGQRRKLCITLALLGSPKFVFLDEPTTGLDPYSRKNIWELLSRKKKGCTMFVTTHYMDEADFLADRKMIISNGNITCLGTSIFLKKTFNMNYSLDINLTNENDVSYINPIIDHYCPNASSTKAITISQYTVNGNDNDNNDSNDNNSNNNAYILTYLLPMEHSHYFKNIFDELTNLINDKNNSISNFSIAAPTLEELFIKLEGHKENNKMDSDIQKIKNITTVDVNSYDDNETNHLLSNLNSIFGKTNVYKSSTFKQIYSIIKIRMKIFIRNKTSALIYTLFPICIIIACIYFSNKYVDSLYNKTIRTFQPLEINPSLYSNLKWFKNSNVPNGVVSDIISKINIADVVDYENQLTIKSKKLTKNSIYVGGFAGTDHSNQAIEFTIYDGSYTFGIPVGINYIYNALLEYYSIDKKLSVNYNPLPVYDFGDFDEVDTENILNKKPEKERIIMEGVLVIAITLAISLSISVFGPLTVKEREDGITWQLFLNGTSRINYWLGVFISDFICLSVPTVLIILAGYLNDISIFEKNIIGYTIAITLFWIISSIVHQYVVCHFFKSYDTCSSLFIIINPILTLFVGLYFLIMDNGSEILFEYAVYVVLIFYVPSSIIFYYNKLTQFIKSEKLKMNKNKFSLFTNSQIYQNIAKNNKLDKIEKSKQAAKAYFKMVAPTIKDFMATKEAKICIILVLTLVISYILILYLREKGQSKARKCHKEYTPEELHKKDEMLMTGPKDIYNEFKRVQEALNENENNKNTINYNKNNNNISIIAYRLNKNYSISQSEMKKREKENENEISNDNEKKIDREEKEKKKNKKNKNNNRENKKESAFVKMDDRITYDEEKKKYTSRIVDDVTLGVDVGQCLGLLGPNGAGKTTSIYMMTGLISRNHGKIVYGHHDLNDTDLSHLSLGYCSQHDSLWKLLTVKETIQFYLNICGYPSSDIPQYTKSLIEACGIENYTNKKVSEISGGTKRKLSLIIAICSSPSYLILDEPSAGMDPFTRRYMWKLISQLKKIRETSTILTTHSTEEAEALCDRIAILIKGNLVCIDTPKSIKMNQSDRYVLEVFTDKPKEFEETYIQQHNLFGLDDDSRDQYRVESSLNYQKYSVEMQSKNIADVFSMMETAKEEGLVSQYNFGQYSLEQVFIDFVNNSK